MILRFKIFSWIFSHSTLIHATLQVSSRVVATLLDLLFDFLLSLMLRSGISFPCPTFYHHFSTPKLLPFDFPTLHHHWSYSPRSSFQFSTVLPPLVLCPKIFPTLWKTWVAYGLQRVFVRHDKILPMKPPI